MQIKGHNHRRFAIALSFPSEHRRFVRNVAGRLAEEFGQDKIFFDDWYQGELRGSDADLKFKRIYRSEAELVVPFFSEHYNTKKWCGIEWKAIRVILMERSEDDAVIPVHIDGTRIEGWELIDLGIRKGRKTGRQIADAIIEVYRVRRRSQAQQIAGEVVPLKLIHPTAEPAAHRPLMLALERAYSRGKLRDSLIAGIVCVLWLNNPVFS